MSSLWHGQTHYGCRMCTTHNATAKAGRGSGAPRGRKPALSDAQILELRALSEFAGWSRQALADRFETNAGAVSRVLAGLTRSRLVATRAHLPSDLEAA